VDRFLNVDLVVHGWDLAHATGLDEHIEPDDVARVRDVAEGFGDAMRNPKAFGPAVEPPAGAGEQEKLLAFLGRRA
ncbi:MAG TPA: TIGR03086 family protein, partial [Acidimicrobiia bacterium]|nr:TIGR03086 family protein [Acidimicrobiia bacterium]